MATSTMPAGAHVTLFVLLTGLLAHEGSSPRSAKRQRCRRQVMREAPRKRPAWQPPRRAGSQSPLSARLPISGFCAVMNFTDGGSARRRCALIDKMAGLRWSR